jgi:NAD(P)-dependent dehydrogenase (short-subunit alcohol dehydrogenase family)
MDKVWLVTGSASGLGRNIAEAVLESGDRLVATARDHPRCAEGKDFHATSKCSFPGARQEHGSTDSQ